MATTKKKRATKSKDVATKSSSKELATMEQFEQQMAADAAADEARLGKSGESNFISIKNKEFTFRGSDLGEEMEVVIVNFASANMYYDSGYDPDDPNAPACCAIGLDENDMLVPFDASPVPQADNCEDCELNEWGSADVGKGKKCNNRKILAVIPADFASSEEVETAFVSISPLSMSNFNKYVKGLSKTIKRPSYGVITLMYFDEESSNEVLKFKAVGPIETPAEMQTIMEQRAMCEAELLAEPDFSNYHEVEKKPRRSAKKKDEPAAKKKGRASKFSK